MTFKRRKPLTRQEQLTSRPVRLVDGEMADEPDGGGRLTLPVKQRGWARWFLRMPAGASKTFEFDPLGRMVWDLCDGKSNVQQIARKLAKKYNVSNREAHVATEKFLTTLAKKGLIGAAVKSKDGRDG